MSERKPYSGRLAYDPDTGFHLGEDGQAVVTLDEGKTWSYAEPGDASHHDRYHQRFAEFGPTSEEDAHHFAVTEDDPHFGGLKQSPDSIAARETSHTETWA